MNFTTSNHGENGHIKISITDPTITSQTSQNVTSQECGYIVFRIQDRDPRTIRSVGLTMISCDCPPLKGYCMKTLLSKMITYLETRDANNDTRIELMVEPDEKTGTTPRSAIRKLKTHYRKFGFENDPAEPRLLDYMIATIGKIKQHIRHHIPRLGQRNRNRSASNSSSVSNSNSNSSSRSRSHTYRRRHTKTGRIPVRRSTSKSPK